MKKLDSNGRRLFVSSEFNANGRLSADLSIGVKNEKEIKEYLDPSKEKIHDHHVIDIHGKSLALSKEDFAVNILDSTPPFDSMDLSGFKPVFDRLNGIINLAGD